MRVQSCCSVLYKSVSPLVFVSCSGFGFKREILLNLGKDLLTYSISEPNKRRGMKPWESFTWQYLDRFEGMLSPDFCKEQA